MGERDNCPLVNASKEIFEHTETLSSLNVVIVDEFLVSLYRKLPLISPWLIQLRKGF